MSATKSGAVVATAVFLALAGAFYEWHEARESQTALLVAQDDRDMLVTRAKIAERKAVQAEREAGGVSRAWPVASAGPPSVTVADSDPELKMGEVFIAAHPEIKPMLVQEVRARFAGMYFWFYRRQGLTSEQIDQFEEIMISGVGSTMPHPTANQRMRLVPSPALPKEEKNRRLRELLGDEGFWQLEEYQKLQDSNYVYQLASALYSTDTPLTAEQGTQLAQVVAKERSRAPWGTVPPGEFWSPIRERARAFLTEPQLAALAGLQAGDELNWASRHPEVSPSTLPAGK